MPRALAQLTSYGIIATAVVIAYGYVLGRTIYQDCWDTLCLPHSSF